MRRFAAIFSYFLQRSKFLQKPLKKFLQRGKFLHSRTMGDSQPKPSRAARQLAMIYRPAAAEASHPTTYRGDDSPSAHKV